MQHLPSLHITTALRGVLDHIDEHDLPLPHGIGTSILPGDDDRIVVVLFAADLEAWTETITVDDERANVQGAAVHQVTDGRLPNGLRVRIRSAALLNLTERVAS